MANYPPSSDPFAGGGEPTGGPPLATWIQRVGATVIDALIGAGITLAGLVLSVILGAVSDTLGVLAFLLGYAGLVAFVIWNYMLRQGRTGQTIGKTQLNIRVARLDGVVPPGVGQCVGRYFLHFLDGIPCFLGYLWPLWDPKRQTFTDKILNTVVVTV